MNKFMLTQMKSPKACVV